MDACGRTVSRLTPLPPLHLARRLGKSGGCGEGVEILKEAVGFAPRLLEDLSPPPA